MAEEICSCLNHLTFCDEEIHLADAQPDKGGHIIDIPVASRGHAHHTGLLSSGKSLLAAAASRQFWELRRALGRRKVHKNE